MTSDRALETYARNVFGPRPSDKDLKVLRADLEAMQTMTPSERIKRFEHRKRCVLLFRHARFEDLTNKQLRIFSGADAARVVPRVRPRAFGGRR
jgi:hypothetical protein